MLNEVLHLINGALFAQDDQKDIRNELKTSCYGCKYDDCEAQVQAKDEEIRRLNNLYADTIKDLGEVLMEIERLKESYAAITNNFECALREIDRLKEQKHNG